MATEDMIFDTLFSDILRFLKEAIEEIIRQYSEEPINHDEIRNLIDIIQQILQLYVLFLGQDPNFSEDDELLCNIKDLLAAVICDEERSNVVRRRGRPEIIIQEDQLRFLLDKGFRVKDISLMFNCSKRTIERRMVEYNICMNRYTLLTDNELDDIIREVSTLFPLCGENMMLGRLRARGIIVQRERVRESLHRIDPFGVMARCQGRLHRRKYTVPSANFLWHIDGYHKLIRWRFVIHGGIDGYSRLITFLRVSTNNRSDTVLGHFLEAVDEFGLPSRVRMDRGGENIGVAMYMVNHPSRGPERGSAITGRSTHNQRIERLWRDLFSGCISFFYYFFYSLEQMQLLEVNSEVDLLALQFVFTPIIQHHLDMFRLGWSHHKLRTEGNRTPMQLWISSVHSTDESAATLCEDWLTFGVDWEGPVALDNDNNHVNVTEPLLGLTDAQKEFLDGALQHLKASEDVSHSAMVAQFVIAKTYINSVIEQ